MVRPRPRRQKRFFEICDSSRQSEHSSSIARGLVLRQAMNSEESQKESREANPDDPDKAEGEPGRKMIQTMIKAGVDPVAIHKPAAQKQSANNENKGEG